MPKFFAELALLFFAFISPVILWTIFQGGEKLEDASLELSEESQQEENLLQEIKVKSPQAKHWVDEHVDSLKKKNWLVPSLNDAVFPDATLTRIEALRWMETLRLQNNIPLYESEENLALASLALESLQDIQSIPEDHQTLLHAFQNGWIQAPLSQTFRPHENLTRAEALSLLLSFFKKDTLSTVIPNFKDVSPYEDWFASMSAFALREGWSQGENFEPSRAITRAEFLKWLDLASPSPQ